MYHAVIQSPLEVPDWCFLDADFFRAQMQYLKNNFEVIPLSAAATQIRDGSIRRPLAVITFDDGFRNNYEVAFPILRAAGLPATLFLVTGLTDTNDTVWFCRLNRALANSRVASLEWNGVRFDLSTVTDKAKASSVIQARLKVFPHSQLLTELRRILTGLDDDPDSPIESDSPFRMLSREEIRAMTATGMIEVGAHTQSHAILSSLSPQEQRNEIEQSLAVIRQLTGRPCDLFAYPNGLKQDYDPESIRILQVSEVQAAVTSIEGVNDRDTPLMELRRYGIGPHLDMTEFEAMMQEAQPLGNFSES